MTDIRFVKRFVLFTKFAGLKDGKIVQAEQQYHTEFGRHHKASKFEMVNDNQVFIEFDESDSFSGSATIDKSYVEKLGGGIRLPDPCCNK